MYPVQNCSSASARSGHQALGFAWSRILAATSYFWVQKATINPGQRINEWKIGGQLEAAAAVNEEPFGQPKSWTIINSLSSRTIISTTALSKENEMLRFVKGTNTVGSALYNVTKALATAGMDGEELLLLMVAGAEFFSLKT
mmetsp:Transcript_21956/g.61022  ORF Transcript_21956/g.61022 Transcript_21956/m.61022 type:complete len:142 (+) Transcript_21956:10495-10920(+)